MAKFVFNKGKDTTPKHIDGRFVTWGQTFHADKALVDSYGTEWYTEILDTESELSTIRAQDIHTNNDEAVSARENAVAEREASAKERENALKDSEDALAKLEKDLAKREKDLAKREGKADKKSVGDMIKGAVGIETDSKEESDESETKSDDEAPAGI